MTGSPKTLTIGNDYLYTFDPATAYPSRTSFLTGFPLASITPTIPVGKAYNTNGTENCPVASQTYLYTNHGNLTLICVQYVRLDYFFRRHAPMEGPNVASNKRLLIPFSVSSAQHLLVKHELS